MLLFTKTNQILPISSDIRFCVILTQATLFESELTPCSGKSIINNHSSIITCSAIYLILTSKIGGETKVCCFPSQSHPRRFYSFSHQTTTKYTCLRSRTSMWHQNMLRILAVSFRTKDSFGFSAASLYCFYTVPSERFDCKHQLIVSFHGSLSTIAAAEIKPVTFLLWDKVTSHQGILQPTANWLLPNNCVCLSDHGWKINTSKVLITSSGSRAYYSSRPCLHHLILWAHRGSDQ